MKFTPLSPKKSLNKAFLRQRPTRQEIDTFKYNLIRLLGKIDEIEREENQKNHLRDFLRDTYYKDTNEVNTKGNIDLVVHLGKSNKDNVGVIAEAKRPSNKGEMFSVETPNSKALGEIILYYMEERITANNNELKNLLITNVYEWYIIDANYFDKYIYRISKIKKLFELYKNDKKDTPFFYDEVSKIIPTIDVDIPCTYFDIRVYKKWLLNEDKTDDKNLIPLLKILSPYHLLKAKFANDSNSLDKAFYTELLHIIGLTETKEGSKKLIQRKEKGQRNSGSLMESAIVQLDNLDKISRLEKPSQFGNNTDERLFNVALELSITWINRILFLKLLEAQLIKYHKGDKNYAFLNTDKVKNFDDLNTLFFQVLAKKTDERNDEVKQLFANVPYLNSSLFEPTEIEHACLFISQLKDGNLPVLSNSVIKDKSGKKQTGELLAIDYIFEFLNAYDFSSEGSEDIQEDNKQLINASVLGLIFEKINGYKDGSFFTPGFITMYMCRETIRRAVVQKFNETKGWNCNGFGELYDKIDSGAEARTEANAIINSLKICDPAVGSGHFLVSALNEMIAIKSELRILSDRDGKRLKEYSVVVENDELIVTDEDGNLIEYNPTSHESQRVQETLFHEKETIIENCLFGVDLNPNSVKICRLRLWIELLKNAYYRVSNIETHGRASLPELETLPNIDINIKCGNSLISRYSLDSDLKKALNSSKWTIGNYRDAVKTYRNTKSKEVKREMEKLILSIKQDFTSEIRRNDPLKSKLDKLSHELYNRFTGNFIFEPDESYGKGNKLEKKKKGEQKKLEDEINAISLNINDIKNNKIYENAFEWRFEFPEVLNDEGDFVGFDVVIGNPPYIRQEEVKDLSYYFEVNYKTYSGKSDIYVFFYEKGIDILRRNGILNYITSGKFFEASYGKPLIDFLIDKCEIHFIINFNDLPVFEGATAYPLIFSGTSNKIEDFSFSYYDLDELPKSTLLEKLVEVKPLVVTKTIFKENDYKFIDNTISTIINKLKQNSISLQDFCGLPIVGVKTGFNDGFITNIESGKYVKDYAFGRDIKKYQKVSSKAKIIFPYNDDFSIANLEQENEINSFLINSKQKLSDRAIIMDGLINASKCWYEYQQVNKTLNYDNEYIVYPNVSFGNNFTISKGVVIDMTAFLIKSNSRYLLAILNSKLIAFLMNIWCISRRGGYLEYKVQYVEKIPIKQITVSEQTPFIVLVNKIIKLKQSNQDTTALESEIDRLVYQLYGLTEEEIKIVEGK